MLQGLGPGLGLALVVLIGGAQAAVAQPSANAIATLETALFCGEVMQRADELANFGLYAPNDRRANDADLDAIDNRYVANIPVLVEQAGYSADRFAARQKAHRDKVSGMVTSAVVAQTSLCGNTVNLQPTDTTTPPKTTMSLALGGRSKTDVMFVDMNTLHRMGPVVSGWQLYVFKADQSVGGKPSKGQWTRFYVDCVNPTFINYGMIGLADLKTDKPYTADARKAPDAQVLKPNTFGAAAWMFACGVTQAGATQASLSAAADYSLTQFVQ